MPLSCALSADSYSSTATKVDNFMAFYAQHQELCYGLFIHCLLYVNHDDDCLQLSLLPMRQHLSDRTRGIGLKCAFVNVS